jgi:hypothetical protein
VDLRVVTPRRAALCGALLAVAASLSAQEPEGRQARRGFWAEWSTGYGVLRAGCSNCVGVRASGGGAGSFLLGGTLSRTVLMGIEFQGWSSIEEDFDERTGTISVVAQWYPSKSRMIFLRGGMGIAQVRVTVGGTGNADLAARSTGVTLNFGAGMDLPLSRRLALTFAGGSYVGAVGDLLFAERLNDTIAAVYQVTVGVTVR